jgi:uncharacterized membrane protein YuzA (DUF378 family)
VIVLVIVSVIVWGILVVVGVDLVEKRVDFVEFLWLWTL